MSVLTPYLLYIKLGLAAVVIALAFGGGCKYQAGRDAKKLAACDKQLTDTRAALAVTAETLRQVDAETLAAQKRAEENARTARQIAEQADRDAAAYRKRLTSIERELVDAKRDPKCRQQLELPVCAALR